MPQLLFPDNTVLVNFALLNRMDLLKRLANGNGRWCATVADECDRSAQEPELGTMAFAHQIFGTPLYPASGAEHLDVRVLRLELAKPEDSATRHLGEAETIAIMNRRAIEGFFVTDDADARRLATKNDIKVVSTWDLLRLALRCNFIDANTGWGYVQSLRARKRGSPPGVNNRATFDRWVS